jgi:hypothetical protein
VTARRDWIDPGHVDPVKAFQLRCQAQALLVRHGELDLHQAVDGLQLDAVHADLVAEIGQDGVQALMAEAFRDIGGAS